MARDRTPTPNHSTANAMSPPGRPRAPFNVHYAVEDSHSEIKRALIVVDDKKKHVEIELHLHEGVVVDQKPEIEQAAIAVLKPWFPEWTFAVTYVG